MTDAPLRALFPARFHSVTSAQSCDNTVNRAEGKQVPWHLSANADRTSFERNDDLEVGEIVEEQSFDVCLREGRDARAG